MKRIVLSALIALVPVTFANAADMCRRGDVQTRNEIVGRNPHPVTYYCVFDHNYNEYVWSNWPEDIKAMGNARNQCHRGQTKTVYKEVGRNPHYETLYCVYDGNYRTWVWSNYPSNISRMDSLTDECELGQVRNAVDYNTKNPTTRAQYCVHNASYGVNVWSFWP